MGKYLLYLCLVGAALACLFTLLPYESVLEGTADLRKVSLEDRAVRVSSGWESYPGSLYEPEVFAPDHAGEAVEWTPALGWSQGMGTHRMTLLLPPGEQVALYFRSADYATRLYLDGQLVAQEGTVGDSRETADPHVGYIYHVFTPQGDRAELVLQYANFHHRRGGDPPELVLGSPAAVLRLAQKERFVEVAVAGALLAAFLYHMALYLFYGKRRVFLWFALCCLLFGARALLPLAIVFYPGYDWGVMLRLEYLDLFTGAALFGLFARSLYPDRLSRGVVWTVAGLLLAYDVVILSTPPLVFSQLLAFYQPLCVGFVAYVAVKLGMGMGKGGPPVRLGFCGVAIFLAAALNDALLYNKLPSLGYSLMPLGIMMFTLAFMMILSMEFAGNQRRLEAERLRGERMQAEKDAAEELNRMKTQFFSALSHELQMPVTVMSGFAQLTGQMMGDEPLDREAVLDNMRRVEEEAGRMERMVRQLLDKAAMERGSFTLKRGRMNLAALLIEVAEHHFPVMDGNHNQILVEAEPGLEVYGDGERLLQVLLNLVSNAVRHTHNGKITLKAEMTGEMAQVTVSDTGTGIDPKLLPELFGRYVKHSDTGVTGLGLYVCKQVVEAHGGGITIKNRQEGGAQVCFTLPSWQGEG